MHPSHTFPSLPLPPSFAHPACLRARGLSTCPAAWLPVIDSLMLNGWMDGVLRGFAFAPLRRLVSFVLVNESIRSSYLSISSRLPSSSWPIRVFGHRSFISACLASLPCVSRPSMRVCLSVCVWGRHKCVTDLTDCILNVPFPSSIYPSIPRSIESSESVGRHTTRPRPPSVRPSFRGHVVLFFSRADHCFLCRLSVWCGMAGATHAMHG
mmetsp:Transcript_17827/g.42874  ORF Transcript_17827/g.42874 Transcript_17827/m.42874 type:complete len:210 (+) Transcript_17827:124-753(+)